MILKYLNIQGIAGIAISLVLAVLLLIQKGETRHWRKESASFEQLYQKEQAAFATTVANYRVAAEQARAADLDNAARVAAVSQAINERTTHDFETRLAAARAAAQRLRFSSEATADSSVGRSASLPGLPAAAGGPAEASGQDRLPAPSREVATSRETLQINDALTATEQAIQLDELIKWVRRQAAIDPNAKP